MFQQTEDIHGAPTLTVTVSAPFSQYQAAFLIPRSQGRIGINIYDMKGGLQHSFSVTADERSIVPVVWDGTNKNGIKVQPGIYAVRLSAGNTMMTRKLVLKGYRP